MAIGNMIRSLNTTINVWFTQPEANAAGRMGLFRILYCLFYLWHFSTHSSNFLSGMPAFYVEKEVYLVKYIFPDFGASLPPLFFHTLESLLVAALVLLAFGYRTRTSTACVLLIGGLIDALSTAIDGKRTILPLVFYIPFFMLIVNSWGYTYSIDSMLRKSKGEPLVDPHTSNWKYFLPARALLILFSGLFFGSAIYKVAFGGAWLSHSDMMSNFFLNRNIEAAIYDLPLNWLAPSISQIPLIYLSAHANVLFFEFCFFLSIVNTKIRDIFVSMALIFHAVNALWLVVTVTPILVGYFIFIDWQAIKDFFFPSPQQDSLAHESRFKSLPPEFLTFLALFLATVLGFLWHSDLGVRSWFNLNGLIDWRTIWYPILPLAFGWFITTLIRFRQPAKI